MEVARRLRVVLQIQFGGCCRARRVVLHGDYEYDAARTSFGGLASANGIGADALELAVGVRGVGYEVDNFRLIPNAMLRYMSGEVDGFTESGPGVPLWVTSGNVARVRIS